MAERWRDYFDGHGAFNDNWLRTAVPHWGFHETLYGMIQRSCAPPARILDVGCGPGWSAMYLASQGFHVAGIDNEPALVEVANQQSERLGSTARFQVADAFDLSGFYGQFDLAYSCGVLEHFDRDVTVRLLREQAKCARLVVIQIPTGYTRYAGGITDERIYSINELAAIVKDAGMAVANKFGYGELNATGIHKTLRLLLPRAMWRLLQNRGYSYAIAVTGQAS